MLITKRDDDRFVILYQNGDLERLHRGVAWGTVFLYEGQLYRAREVDSYYNGELSYVVTANEYLRK